MAITGYNVLQDAKTIKDIKIKQDENSQEILDINEHLGDMTQVPTTSKTASGAIAELFTDVSNGKNAISGAITDEDSNVVIPTNPSFGDLTNAIGQISTGKKWASGTIVSSSTTLPFIGGNNMTYHRNFVTVTGLNFRPRTVVMEEGSRVVYASEDAPLYGFNYHRVFLGGTVDYLTGNAYFSDGEFQLQAVGSGLTYTWIAME